MFDYQQAGDLIVKVGLPTFLVATGWWWTFRIIAIKSMTCPRCGKPKKHE